MPIKSLVFGLFFVLVGLKLTGKVLDYRAEHSSRQMFQFDEEGIIVGAGPVAIQKGSQRAVVFIPGLLQSTQIFQNLAKDLASRINADFYIPLMPHMGRNLDSLRRFNNEDNLAFIKSYLSDLSNKYNSLEIIGHSYGATLLVHLHRLQELPSNARYTFYAPALYVPINDMAHKMQINAFLLFRKYCDYKAIGCTFPSYESGDEGARSYLDNQMLPPYIVLEPVLQVFDLDTEENQRHLASFPESHVITMAKDDNRVNFIVLSKVCQENPRCQLVSYDSGSHVVHQGNRRQEFADNLVQIMEL